MLSLRNLANPILRACDNLRDPSVWLTPDGYSLFYTRLSNDNWDCPENWSVARRLTKDFVTFEDDDAADKAVAALNGSQLDGRTIRVDVAQAKQRTGGGGGNGRGGNSRGGYGDRW